MRAELRKTLAHLWPELSICAEAEDGFEAVQAIHQHAPSILFLDIEMPGISGLEGGEAGERAVRRYRRLVTAYDQPRGGGFRGRARWDYVSAAVLSPALPRHANGRAIAGDGTAAHLSCSTGACSMCW